MNLVSREKAIDVAIDEYNRGYKEGFEAGKASVFGGGDLISRQDAIDICRKYNGYGSIWSCILSDIQHLPSAQPERKKGKWILNRDDTLFWNCSCCGELSDYKYRFCPDCGADMRQGGTE